MKHVADRVAELALGTLAADERASLEAHLEECSSCRDEVVRTRGALSGLGLAGAPRRPSAVARDRLLSEVRGPKRLWPFTDRVAKLFDLGDVEVQGYFGRLDDERSWTPDPQVPGLSVCLVTPGPSVEAVLAGFGRFATGSHYPRHRHVGPERFLVLQGGLKFDDGSLGNPGDDLIGPTGTAHSFDVLPGPAFLAAVVLHGPIEFEPEG